MKARGFTLVELVVVIVLLGITAVTFTSLITGSVLGYLDTANRQDSAATARIALDRIARELREAIPQSIRINNGCLQFLPITASTVYTDLIANATDIKVIDFAVPAGNRYAVVYPINATELYDGGSATAALRIVDAISDVDANGLRTLTLAAGFPAPRNSPGERLYVVNDPVSFCFVGNTIRRYTSGITPDQPVPGAGFNVGDGALLIDHVVAPTTFRFDAGNWQNNALVGIVLTIQQANNETLQFDHEVWLRNVQ